MWRFGSFFRFVILQAPVQQQIVFSDTFGILFFICSFISRNFSFKIYVEIEWAPRKLVNSKAATKWLLFSNIWLIILRLVSVLFAPSRERQFSTGVHDFDLSCDYIFDRAISKAHIILHLYQKSDILTISPVSKPLQLLTINSLAYAMLFVVAAFQCSSPAPVGELCIISYYYNADAVEIVVSAATDKLESTKWCARWIRYFSHSQCFDGSCVVSIRLCNVFCCSTFPAKRRDGQCFGSVFERCEKWYWGKIGCRKEKTCLNLQV